MFSICFKGIVVVWKLDHLYQKGLFQPCFKKSVLSFSNYNCTELSDCWDQTSLLLHVQKILCSTYLCLVNSWLSLRLSIVMCLYSLCPSEGSLHSSDSVSDSSPPPAVVQTGVPTQVVQQVQTAQQVKSAYTQTQTCNE